MTIKALTGLVAEWYTPDDERDEAIQSQFKLQPLNGMQYIEIMSHGEALESGNFLVNHIGRQLLLKYGLVGWKNVEQVNGDPLPFSRNNIEMLPAAILAELGNEILTVSSLVEAERKNLSSQSKSSKIESASSVEAVSGEDTVMKAIPRHSSSG